MDCEIVSMVIFLLELQNETASGIDCNVLKYEFKLLHSKVSMRDGLPTPSALNQFRTSQGRGARKSFLVFDA